MSTLIQCPICGRENEFFAEPVGPFCTARCKQIDLGKWLGEEYRIPGALSLEALEDEEEADR